MAMAELRTPAGNNKPCQLFLIFLGIEILNRISIKREKKHDSVLIDMRTRIFTRYVNVRLQKKRAGAWIPLQACQCPLLFREPPLATFSHPASQRWMTRKTPCRGTTSLCRDLYLRSLATLARGHLKDIHDVWLVSGAAWAKLKSLR